MTSSSETKHQLATDINKYQVEDGSESESDSGSESSSGSESDSGSDPKKPCVTESNSVNNDENNEQEILRQICRGCQASIKFDVNSGLIPVIQRLAKILNVLILVFTERGLKACMPCDPTTVMHFELCVPKACFEEFKLTKGFFTCLEPSALYEPHRVLKTIKARFVQWDIGVSPHQLQQLVRNRRLRGRGTPSSDRRKTTTSKSSEQSAAAPPASNSDVDAVAAAEPDIDNLYVTGFGDNIGSQSTVPFVMLSPTNTFDVDPQQDTRDMVGVTFENGQSLMEILTSLLTSTTGREYTQVTISICYNGENPDDSYMQLTLKNVLQSKNMYINSVDTKYRVNPGTHSNTKRVLFKSQSFLTAYLVKAFTVFGSRNFPLQLLLGDCFLILEMVFMVPKTIKAMSTVTTAANAVKERVRKNASNKRDEAQHDDMDAPTPNTNTKKQPSKKYTNSISGSMKEKKLLPITHEDGAIERGSGALLRVMLGCVNTECCDEEEDPNSTKNMIIDPRKPTGSDSDSDSDSDSGSGSSDTDVGTASDSDDGVREDKKVQKRKNQGKISKPFTKRLKK